MRLGWWTGLFLAGCVAVGGVNQTSWAAEGATSEAQFAHIEIRGEYPEGAAMPGLFGEMHETLATAISRLDKAAGDKSIKGVILRINDPKIGWAKANTLRQAIGRIRASGKKVHAYLDDGSNADFFVAIACDRIVMPESGSLMLVGLRAEVTFYKKLFDKVGVHADMLRVGEFKSAAEPYSRSEMSPEFRLEMEELLDDLYKQLTTAVAESRKLPVEKVSAAIDAGPISAKQAKEWGLIDEIAYQDQLEASLAAQNGGAKVKLVKKYGKKKIDTDFSGFAGMIKFMELLMGVDSSTRKSLTPKIAVIYGTGPIMTGRSQSDLFSGETTLGSETLIKAIRDANADAQVKAIVLRVDSPGGSALASDLIWRELQLVKKPFIVSMGNVAASGGYYISMGANKIYAEPGTITGSIGVVGGKLALGGLFDKIGVTTSVVSRGKNSGVFSGTTPFSDSERAAMQKLLNDIYDQFTSKAAQGRKMKQPDLEKLARGRVYTGNMAKKLGLIDEIGTLDDAVAEAVKAAGLKPDDKYERLNLPKAVSPFEALFGPIDPNEANFSGRIPTGQGTSVPASDLLLQALRDVSPDLAEQLHSLRIMTLLSKERTLMVLPYRMTIK